MEIREAFELFSKDVSRVSGRRDGLRVELETAKKKVDILDADLKVLDRVSDLFRAMIDREVLDNVRAAQDLVTEGMQAVFSDLNIALRAEVDISRGKVSVDLITVQTDPVTGVITEGASVDAYGGSVSTVQSILLRLVVMHRRGLRPLMILDESLTAVAEDYVPRVGQFLSLLAQRMGIDILAVTHSEVLVETADRAYRIQKKDGEAKFAEIRT